MDRAGPRCGSPTRRRHVRVTVWSLARSWRRVPRRRLDRGRFDAHAARSAPSDSRAVRAPRRRRNGGGDPHRIGRGGSAHESRLGRCPAWAWARGRSLCGRTRHVHRARTRLRAHARRSRRVGRDRALVGGRAAQHRHQRHLAERARRRTVPRGSRRPASGGGLPSLAHTSRSSRARASCGHLCIAAVSEPTFSRPARSRSATRSRSPVEARLSPRESRRPSSQPLCERYRA